MGSLPAVCLLIAAALPVTPVHLRARARVGHSSAPPCWGQLPSLTHAAAVYGLL